MLETGGGGGGRWIDFAPPFAKIPVGTQYYHEHIDSQVMYCTSNTYVIFCVPYNQPLYGTYILSFNICSIVAVYLTKELLTTSSQNGWQSCWQL